MRQWHGYLSTMTTHTEKPPVGTFAAMKSALSRDAIAALSAEIAKLKLQGSTAYADIERLERASAEAENFDAAEAIEREITKRRWAITQADRRLPELEAQLAAARADKQSRAIAKHAAQQPALYRELRRNLEATAAVQAKIIKQREAAIAEIGEQAANTHLPHIAYRGLLLPDLVELWVAEMERIFPPSQLRRLRRRRPHRKPPRLMKAELAAAVLCGWTNRRSSRRGSHASASRCCR